MTVACEPIRVLIADDTATVRLVLRRTLESSKSFEVVGEAVDGAQAVAMAGSLQPDMVLLDLSMPVLGGMEAIPRIRRCAPSAQVVVLSSFASDQAGPEAVAVGAAAFLEKQQRPDDLLASLLQTWRSTRAVPTEAPPDCFRRAFRHAPLPMAVVGIDGRVRYANPALCRLTAYEPDDLGALTVADLIHPEDRDAVRASHRSVAGGTVPTSTVDARLVRPDGRTVCASISCSTIDDAGDGRWLVVQLVDVTEQRQRERELARSNAELSRFAFLAAHELKSPLQAVSGFAALLDQMYGPELEPQAREFVGWIADGATRMDSVIEGLLAYCSVDSDDILHEAVDLDEVATDALRQLDCQVAARKAVVSVDVLPWVTGDQVQMGELLQNLLVNALKFVPDDRRPEVHVSAERALDCWTVTVADNGIGVDDAARERIFAMFERLHPRERFKGTGIGLSICKRIVERQGGTIWVEPNPGGGSRFRFTVPDVVSPASSMPAA